MIKQADQGFNQALDGSRHNLKHQFVLMSNFQV